MKKNKHGVLEILNKYYSVLIQFSTVSRIYPCTCVTAKKKVKYEAVMTENNMKNLYSKQ